MLLSRLGLRDRDRGARGAPRPRRVADLWRVHGSPLDEDDDDDDQEDDDERPAPDVDPTTAAPEPAQLRCVRFAAGVIGRLPRYPAWRGRDGPGGRRFADRD